VSVENMLWIDDIVEKIPTISFFINLKIHMTGLVHLDKVVVKKNAFSTFPIA